MATQSEQGYHPLLPKLKRGDRNKVKIFNKAGEWEVRNAAELDNVSASLNVEQVECEVNSIPDMWARPLTFEMALFDPDHVLHKRVMGEWRGLMAMLALKEIRNLQGLEVVQVKAPKIGATKGAQAPLPAFMDALNKISPKKTLSQDTQWCYEDDDFWFFPHVILFDNQPIGMTSPTTLVCAATDYYGRIFNVPWCRGRLIDDPIQWLNDEERQEVAGWLNRLKQGLTSHPALNEQMIEFELLLGIIGDANRGFAGDLLRGLKYQSDLSVKLSERGFGLTYGILRYLDKPVKGERNGRSHVVLSCSRKPEELSELEKRDEILVVDRNISDHWGMREQDVIVIGTATLADLPFGGLGQERKVYGRVNIPEGLTVLEPNDFFTRKLFVVSQQGAFPGSIVSPGAEELRHQGMILTPILPVQPWVLSHLVAEDLGQRISFEQSVDGITVRLRLTLSGPDGKGRNLEIKREFRPKKREIEILSNVPAIEVWPNFVADGWRAYYSYFSTAGERGAFYAEPFVAGKIVDRQIVRASAGTVELELVEMDRFPEAMICREQRSSTDGVHHRDTAGLIILKPPQQVGAQPKTCKIGVDFGTTSTNIYALEEGDDVPSRVEFAERFLQVTASGIKRSRLYDEFIPGQSEKAPFLTFFHEFVPQTGAGGREIRPLLDGHIFFLDKRKELEVLEDVPGSVATDLKWSPEPVDRQRTKAFLAQVCLQCAAEAAARRAREISWRYSYPLAFCVQKRRQGLPEIWRDITKWCGKLTGLKMSHPDPIAQTESVASATYFADSQGAPTAQGTICIDIGGGTSDVAVWQQDKLLLQTSLRMAGRDIFLELLRAKPQFLEIFGTNVSSLKPLQNKPVSFYAQADAIIMREGDSWLKQLPIHSAREEVQEFVQLLALGLSGVLYYVGLLLRYLRDSGKYSEQTPDLYVGGNGAKIFRWLACGEYCDASPIKILFSNILSASSGLASSEPIKVIMSNTPKAEVAYGLVGKKKLAWQENGEGEIIAGEGFLRKGEQCNWDTRLSPDDFKGGLRAPQELYHLERFLEILNQYAKSKGSVILPIEYDSKTLEEIRKRLDGALLDFTKYKDSSDITVEPLFVLALKELLKTKIAKWALEKSK